MITHKTLAFTDTNADTLTWPTNITRMFKNDPNAAHDLNYFSGFISDRWEELQIIISL